MVIFRPLAETPDQAEVGGVWQYCGSGVVSWGLLNSQKLESIFNGLASYFLVDVDMPNGSGGLESARTGCVGGGKCRFSAIRFRSGAHGECIWHVKCQHKVSGGSLRWSFSVDFVARLMGQV
jgi:hypothetical protein